MLLGVYGGIVWAAGLWSMQAAFLLIYVMW